MKKIFAALLCLTTISSSFGQVDGQVLKIVTGSYVILGNIAIKAELKSNGITWITSLDLNYSIDNGPTTSENLTVSMAQGSILPVTHGNSWSPSSAGVYSLKIWISNVNGGGVDTQAWNDTLTKTINVRNPIPNIIPSYESTSNSFVYNVIANSSNQISTPRDLDFNVNGDLWAINKNTVNSGGSTVKITNPGKPGQNTLWQRDGNAWHFMSLPTGIAFSTENGNFANSTGIFDANHNNTDFTGPSLWSSDPNIYAQTFPGNGSHLDMLHESPYCMGIAHEVDNVFWVFDAYSNDIVRYDFADDHGPGGSNHDDGKVRRFPELAVNWINANIASHLVLDKKTNWLYIVDGGNNRILRMDITTGTPGGIPSFIANELMAEYTNVTGVTWEVVASTGLVQASGIDIVGNRLIVSDYSNGDIIIFDVSPTATMPASEVGRLVTNDPGIMGIVIGPEGRIWYANADDNEIVKIEPSSIILGVENIDNGNEISIYPNPSNGLITIENQNNSNLSTSILLTDVSGKEIYNNKIVGLKNNFDFSYLSNGMYFISVNNGQNTVTEKLVIKH